MVDSKKRGPGSMEEDTQRDISSDMGQTSQDRGHSSDFDQDQIGENE